MHHWIRRSIGIAAFAIVCAYAIVALRGPQGMAALLEKRRQIRQLEDQNATLSREIRLKRDRIERLRHSPSEQDLEIRRQLKLLRPGETSFILPESKPEVHPAPSAAQ